MSCSRTLSAESRDVVNNIFEPDAAARIAIDHILDNSWMLSNKNPDMITLRNLMRTKIVEEKRKRSREDDEMDGERRRPRIDMDSQRYVASLLA